MLKNEKKNLPRQALFVWWKDQNKTLAQVVFKQTKTDWHAQQQTNRQTYRTRIAFPLHTKKRGKRFQSFGTQILLFQK